MQLLLQEFHYFHIDFVHFAELHLKNILTKKVAGAESRTWNESAQVFGGC